MAQGTTLHQWASMEGPGTTAARAWLAAMGMPMVEHIRLPGAGNRAPKPAAAKRWQEDPIAGMLQVYPNPARDQVWMVLQLPEGMEQAELRIMDPLGRLVGQWRVGNGTPIVEYQPAHGNGLYIAGLYLQGQLAGHVKFQVQR